jgi:ribonuclease P protein component
MQGLRFTFPKQHRLVGKKNIQTLLSKGEAFFVHPYRIVYLLKTKLPTDSPIQLVIAVPKRKCKLATQRNTIKRTTREAYRLQQHLLLPSLQATNLQLHIMLQYTQVDAITFADASKSLQKILNRLQIVANHHA